jgi:hypothetical protein
MRITAAQTYTVRATACVSLLIHTAYTVRSSGVSFLHRRFGEQISRMHNRPCDFLHSRHGSVRATPNPSPGEIRGPNQGAPRKSFSFTLWSPTSFSN